MNETPRKSLGNRIRAKREARGLSQQAFALMIGIDRSYLIGIEKGTRNPSFDVLYKVAGGFDMTVSELLRGL